MIPPPGKVKKQVRLPLILGSVATTVLLVACTTAVEPVPNTSNGSTDIRCSNCPAIPVERIIDGDTFQSANATVRLYGIDTPERGEPCYDEATQRLRELAGSSVRMESGPRQEDSYAACCSTPTTGMERALTRRLLGKDWP
jgi:endonuclease YncB( thermonuclease family)